MNTTPPSSPVYRAYALLVAWASMLQSPLLLAIRLYWGWQFCHAGWGKLQTHGDVTEYFMSLHIPLPGLNAWLVGVTECCGGMLLLIGLASRLAALPLIATMVVAYLTAEYESLQVIFSDSSKFIGATPFLFLLACLIVLAFGPGVFSFDYVLGWYFRTRCAEGASHPKAVPPQKS
jgi:putative oxidoreductase